MSSETDQGIDLLEIYHARQLRDEILTCLRRLRLVNPPGRRREVRTREICRYYEASLLTIVELLGKLGDDIPLV